MVLPGVGRLTAMTLVAEIGDIARFPTARKLCAWAGLTPQVRNSDRTLRHGHITKQGSPWVRGILQEAAQTAKRHPMLPPPTPSWPAAGAATSPPWRSPGGCWPALQEWGSPPAPEGEERQRATASWAGQVAWGSGGLPRGEPSARTRWK